MTERDPRDVEQALEDYVEATQDSPTPGFTDWVMRSVATEPLPRRGLLAALAALVALPGPYRRAAQVALVGLLLVASLGTAMVVGSALDLTPGPGDPSPTPSIVPSPSPSPEPSDTASPEPSPSTGPATPSPAGTPEPSPDDESETPDPGETPEPSETPDD